MGTKEKLIKRFKNQPKDFTFDELLRLFQVLEFEVSQKGKTSGSRVEFVNKKMNSLTVLINRTPIAW